MITSRRSFLAGLASLVAAPAIARVADLMPIKVYSHILYGDGIHDDADALQALLDRYPVYRPDGSLLRAWVNDDTVYIPRGRYSIASRALIAGGDGPTNILAPYADVVRENAPYCAIQYTADRPTNPDAFLAVHGKGRLHIEGLYFSSNSDPMRCWFNADSRAHAHAQRT